MVLAVTAVLMLTGIAVVPASAADAGPAPAGVGGVVPLNPARLLDTRSGVGASGPVGANRTVELQVTGRGGVPASGVGAVVLNVTVTKPVKAGYVTVWPSGSARPTASNLNFVAGQTVPNLVVVKVGVGGRVSLANVSPGSAQLVADVSGYVLGGSVSAPGGVVPLSPSRVLDTRSGVGASGPVGANRAVDLQVTGRGGVPASGVGAVVLNVTVTKPVKAGYVTVYPVGTTRPTASNLNFVAGQTVPNLVVVKVGVGGRVSLANVSPGSAQLVADVSGYVLGGSVSAPGGVVPLSPSRVLDTRSGVGASGPVGANRAVDLQVTGRGGVPASGVGAVVLNVTVTKPVKAGYVTVYPVGTTRPTASNLNFVAGQTVPNLVVVKVGDGGWVRFTNMSAGTVQIVADVAGWTSPAWGVGSYSNTSVGDLPLDHVECLSADRCVSVSDGLSGSFGATGWSFTSLPRMPDASDPVDMLPSDLRCADDGTCASPALYYRGPLDTQTRVVMLRRAGTWTVGAFPRPTGNPVGVSNAPVAADCAGTDWCTAVGDYYDLDTGRIRPLAALADAGSWSLVTVPVPDDLAGNASLVDVSCPAEGTCTALGQYEAAGGVTRAFTTRLGPGAPQVATAALPSSAWLLEARLDCPSTSFCGVGGSASSDTTTWAVTGTLHDASFALAVTPRTGPGTGGVLHDVACPVDGTCVAVGFEIRPGDVFRPVASRLATGSWTTQVLPVPPGIPTADWQGNLTSISCASAELCAAVSADEFVFTWAAGAWQTAEVLPAEADGFQTMSDVGCVPGGRCMVTGRVNGPDVGTFAW